MGLSVKINQLTGPSTTGNQAITDPGFQPSLLMLWNGLQTASGGSASAQWSMGAASSTTTEVAAGFNNNNNIATADQTIRFTSTTRHLVNFTSGTVTSNIVSDLTSFDGSGYTLNWATLLTSSPIFNYLTIGGSDITNVKTGSFSTITTTGNQSVTGVGFQPDIVFFFGTLQTAAGQASNNNNYGWGVSTASSQWAMGQKSQTGQTTKNTSRSFDNTSCFILPSSTSDTIAHATSLVSFDADGFTVNHTASAALALVTGYIAIKGGQWKVGTDTQPTSSGTKATTGAGFTPSLAIYGSACDTQASGSASNARLMLGATDGTRNVSLWTGARDAVGTSNSSTIMSNNKCLVMATENGASPTTNAEASLSSFDSDGFTLNWSTADASARRFGYVLGGANPVANDTGDFFAIL